MNKNEITTLIRFNFWANGRILAACEQLAPEQFTRPITPNPGWGSLREILVHTLDTEYGWRTALQELPDVILDASDFADVSALQARWETEKAAWLNYVNGLDDDSINQGYGADSQSSPLVWQTIMHVVFHSIQHRSETAVVLTAYGHSPGELDFDMFLKGDFK